MNVTLLRKRPIRHKAGHDGNTGDISHFEHGEHIDDKGATFRRLTQRGRNAEDSRASLAKELNRKERACRIEKGFFARYPTASLVSLCSALALESSTETICARWKHRGHGLSSRWNRSRTRKHLHKWPATHMTPRKVSVPLDLEDTALVEQKRAHRQTLTNDSTFPGRDGKVRLREVRTPRVTISSRPI